MAIIKDKKNTQKIAVGFITLGFLSIYTWALPQAHAATADVVSNNLNNLRNIFLGTEAAQATTSSPSHSFESSNEPSDPSLSTLPSDSSVKTSVIITPSASNDQGAAASSTTDQTNQRHQTQNATETDSVYTQHLETILNENLPPKDQSIQTKTKKATTTPVISSVSPSRPVKPQTSIINSATSAHKNFFGRTTNGNQLAESALYAPFDSLSPELTYAFGALAILCGIAGSALILTEPQEESIENFDTWTRSISTETLLES